MRQQWEYLTKVWNIGNQPPDIVTADMSVYGSERWELVQAIQQGMSLTAFFKRPVLELPEDGDELYPFVKMDSGHTPPTYEKRDDD